MNLVVINKLTRNYNNKYNINITVTEEEQQQIKSLEDFFIMGANIPSETDVYAVNPNSFKLIIEGEVENPTTLNYEDLITQFEIIGRIILMP